MSLQVQKLTDNAIIPKRGSKDAVGYDIYSIDNYEILPGKQVLIGTGIALSILVKHYGRIAPHSELTWKTHTDVGAGVIDPDYRGEVKVILRNLSPFNTVTVKKGERVAQLILEKCSILEIEEVLMLDYMHNMSFQAQKLTNNAIIPKRGSTDAVGYDIYSIDNYEILPGKQVLIGTGIALSIPVGHYGRVAPRSGLSWKKHTDVGAGVINPNDHGEVKVILRNLSPFNTVTVEKGERVAQLILEKCAILEIEEVLMLDETVRGEGGFGSTGV